MRAIISFFRRPLGIIILIIATAGVTFVVLQWKNRNGTQELIQVTRGTITQEVTVTGKTQPVQSADLAFEINGKITRIYVDVGSRVTDGQILIQLNQSELLAQLRQAAAELLAEQAKLDELKRGTRPEEIAIKEVEVANAKVSLEDARRNLTDKIQDAYTKADDAVRNKTDQLFSGPRGPYPQLNFVIADGQLKAKVETGRKRAEETLILWKSSLDALTPAANLIIYSADAKRNLNEIKTFLDDLVLVINMLSSNTSLTITSIDAYRLDNATARTNINAALNNLSQAEEKLSGSQSSLALAENELALAKSGSTPEEIKTQEARAGQAQAKVELQQAILAKTTLRSPLAGVVTKQDGKLGQTVAINTPVVSVISENNLEIEANVPEIDIGNVQIGNPVRITIDAFPNEEFNGKVAFIDPAETIVDGVVNFQVKVTFDREDTRFKSGLTSNLTIQTLEKPGVLLLPQFAILETEGETTVQKIIKEEIVEIPIKVGIRGRNGMAEVISGLSEGDQVVSGEEKK